MNTTYNLNDKLIFVHIPKTGGTTFYSVLNNTYWNAEPNFNYRHIVEKTKSSNAGDIFNSSTNEKYKEHTILMMLRHPVDKVISEYYFFKEMETLMRFIKKRPTDIISFIKEKQTQNATINFLKGRRLYDNQIVNQNDLDDVIESIEKLNIHVGFFEEYLISLEYFSNITNIKWNKNIEVKRITLNRPKINEIDESLKDLILESNKLDFELYNYCLKKFKQRTLNLTEPKINLIKDRYNHIIRYTLNACLFGFCMENKKYLTQNFHFFKNLTFYLLKNKEIKDGRLFTNIWNHTFLKAVSIHFPESDFYQKIHMDNFNLEDPLEDTMKIASTIDLFFKENALTSHKYYTPMVFNEVFVITPFIKKTGFFSKLFNK